jgi:hypothetical protein
MSASCNHADSTRSILLTTLGGAVVSIIVCAGAFQRLGAAPTAAPSPILAAATTPSPAVAIGSHELGAPRTECDSTVPAAALDDDEPPRSTVIVPITRAKERDLRAAFVALERAEPGALDARAAEVLSSAGPTTEKVALLRALRDTASPATAHWLDVAVRGASGASGASDARAQLLPTFALEQLTELAAHDSDACTALGQLAFDAQNVALDLRRRACAGYASACSADSLSDLSSRLWREQDELVIAGALSALESRSSEPQAQRVLAIHQYTRAESHVDESESSN